MAKTTALIFGIIYTLVGIIGFIGGLGGTTGIATTKLLNTFNINVVHNIVHLVIGIPGLLVAGNEERAAAYLKTFGWILIIVGIVGIFWQNPFGILPIGGVDVVLHLVTGIIFAFVGYRAAGSVRATAS
jgi:multisubunit Na+/H+ antiporter MnhG subunit